ncbi:ABC transporter permease subunit [Catellatospora sichuanensis]|uniref:ABC transporter permease subunit n=1 Tax=Catellatospora sichuanensis TaxID=1969805 RepID=UPI001643495A|nr:ABC transporter permease subunit [Catellatospora sichuanensis]
MTWRQHRAQVLATAGLLLGLGVLLLASAMDATRYLAEHVVAGCPGPAEQCHDVNVGLSQRYGLVYQAVLGILPLLGPALIGAFWGAPLIGREFERGTNKLAWTQSVTLGRWLGTKVGLLAVLVVVAGLALSAMVGAWLSVFDGVVGPAFSNAGLFNLVGVAAAAWWLFAFVLGAAISAVLRRTLASMAVTFAVIALVFPIMVFARDAYAEPLRAAYTEYEAILDQGAILTGNAWTDPSGREIAGPPADLCPPAPGEADSAAGQQKRDSCLAERGFISMVEYHPVSRFWRFQWIQAAILAAATVLVGTGALVWTLRRRH